MNGKTTADLSDLSDWEWLKRHLLFDSTSPPKDEAEGMVRGLRSLSKDEPPDECLAGQH